MSAVEAVEAIKTHKLHLYGDHYDALTVDPGCEGKDYHHSGQLCHKCGGVG